MKYVSVIEKVVRGDKMVRGLFLRWLIEKYNIKTVLEIGTGEFFATLWMAKAGAKVETLDIADRLRYVAEQHGKTVCDLWEMPYELFGKIKVTIGDSAKVLPIYNKTYDMIFIDGDHAYEGVYSDLKNSLRLSDRFIVLHDHCVKGTGVKKAIHKLLGVPKTVFTDFRPGEKMGMVVAEKIDNQWKLW